MREKRGLRDYRKRSPDRKGQVTIFVIISILVIAGIVLFFILRPESVFKEEEAIKNPKKYIHSCINPVLKENTRNVSLQGGSINPEPATTYNGKEVEYLCYVDTPYYECVIQQPFLRQHIEEEIKKGIEDDVKNCFNQLKEKYKNNGYDVSLDKGKINVEILPKIIKANFKEYKLNIEKEQEAKEYKDFGTAISYDLYKMTDIANSILFQESIGGKAEPLSYMFSNTDLKIERTSKYDGTNIYTLTNRQTKNKFRFASKSLVFP